MPSGIKYLWFTSQGGSKGPFLVEVPCLKKKKYKTKLKIKNKKNVCQVPCSSIGTS